MAAVSPSRKSKLITDWISYIDNGDTKRQWGQVVEAAEEYTKITRQMRRIITEDSGTFNDQEKQYLDQARRELHQQATILRDFTLSKNYNKDKINQIRQNLLSMNADNEDLQQKTIEGVSSLVSPQCLNITVERIGIKNASSYSQPFIKVNLLTSDGESLGESYETIYSSTFEKDYIIFNSSPIMIKTPINQLPTGCAIFFELHHYKHSKRKTSIKCFTFMEQDEFKSGPAALEIYKKPIDVTRKKLTLLTNRQLYLHLNLSID